MNTGKVVAKIETLQNLLDLAGFALKHPRCEERHEVIAEAEFWLDELIEDFLVDFNEIYDLEHTGEEFWESAYVLGLQDNDSLMSDLQVCVQMRRLLQKVRKRLVKQLPILFGGVRRGNAKAKTQAKARDEDPESNNGHVNG